MNNISDKNAIILIISTIMFVFALIFSVKSPERKVIDSPILWKDDFTNISRVNNVKNNFKDVLFPKFLNSRSFYVV